MSKRVPGMLAAPVRPKVSWPSPSGQDARIDPFGEGTPQAWGKAALYLNWCDPDQPVSRPTATRQWWKRMFRELTGRDVGPLSATRVPEIIVQVRQDHAPVPGAQVFCLPLEEQGVVAHGVRADPDGRSWFVLPEEGRYRFTCRRDGRTGSVEVEARRHRIQVEPGYGHIQWVEMELVEEPF
jgi:hypothetical protein